jgi:hypothetical protein
LIDFIVLNAGLHISRFAFSILVFYTVSMNANSSENRITLAKNARGKPRSPRPIWQLLCANPRARQADLEIT